ncbi:NlpC/P60 family protein [Pseudofrankia sp. DC12]|uniref:C40 family peptidase n=1 Tax=Pseudofrankia sp. DC12 TaxID=683315 RepID=UPI0032D59360
MQRPRLLLVRAGPETRRRPWRTDPGGIDLPRTAQTQYEAGPVLPPEEPLQIGDLLYYGTATNIHHVAIYIGNGQMITASGRGQVVKIAPYRWQVPRHGRFPR